MQTQQPTPKPIKTITIRGADDKVLLEWCSTSQMEAPDKAKVVEDLKQASKAVR